MGLFSNIFGSKNTTERPAFPWKDLTAIAQLSDIVTASHKTPQLIFKHSTRCGISRMVKGRFENNFNTEEAEVYYLDLLKYRDVSNAIASRFDVIHQSPQLLILKNGSVVAHENHGAINAVDLELV